MVIKFLRESIFSRFGCPHKLVTDNAATFRAKELVEMCDSMGIKLVHSTSYYPQGNGLAESSNKSLIRIVKKRTIKRIGIQSLSMHYGLTE